MFRPRIIPVLLLKNRGVVKSVQFNNHKYVGDPINAVRIFSGLKADELMFLDIEASKQRRMISLDFVRNVGEEASMPFGVGGGISSIADIKEIINAGAEKVIINTAALEDPDFITRASDAFGSSTIVACIDVKKTFLKGQRAWGMNGTRAGKFSPVAFARLMEENGAGEIIIQSIDQDGTMTGYDIDLIKSVSTAVNVPVVALGGAGKMEDLVDAYKNGLANGLAAGSLFVYQSIKRGVLINYPDKNALRFA